MIGKSNTNKKPALSRRDFLKLASTMALVPALDQFAGLGRQYLGNNPDLPNVIFILFDALSAFNLSLYGYPRQTSPNLDRFASKATVYHNHRSAGNFTTPSTASLFTSTYPWTHRAYTLTGLITQSVRPNNVFRFLDDAYFQSVFTQNIYADMLLHQFEQFINHHQDLDSFTLAGNTFYNKLFDKDAVHGLKSYDQFLFKREEAHGSLFLSILNDLNVQLQKLLHTGKLAEIYPYGLPRLANTDLVFTLEQVMDGVLDMLSKTPSPSFSYVHLMPPHEPYTPTSQYLGMFDDGWMPEPKKRHRLSTRVPEERLNDRRATYDEFIANLDAEFGRLINQLEKTGVLENSYVVFTSDHGELFERGVHGHSTPQLFEPVIRIPLVISSPGQNQRKDIYTNTSNVDIMPTLMNIAGLETPDRCEGSVLPGLGGEEIPDRSLYTVEGKKNTTHGPMEKATIALVKEQHKLVYYTGYSNYDGKYELYDLNNDPDELENLYPGHPAAEEMQAELDQAFQAADQPYRNKK
jgi:arylsulfatase A-like enzyme